MSVHDIFLSTPSDLRSSPQVRTSFVLGEAGGSEVNLQPLLQSLLLSLECQRLLLIHIVFPIDGGTVAYTGDSNVPAVSTILRVYLVRRFCHSRSQQFDGRAEWWINDGR